MLPTTHRLKVAFAAVLCHAWYLQGAHGPQQLSCTPSTSSVARPAAAHLALLYEAPHCCDLLLYGRGRPLVIRAILRSAKGGHVPAWTAQDDVATNNSASHASVHSSSIAASTPGMATAQAHCGPLDVQRAAGALHQCVQIAAQEHQHC